MKKLLISALAILTVGTCASQQYVLKGAGAQSCGTYLASRAQQTRQGATTISREYLQWTAGYMSGMNLTSSPRKLIPDDDALMYAMDNECRKTPLGHYFGAVLPVFWSLPDASSK